MYTTERVPDPFFPIYEWQFYMFQQIDVKDTEKFDLS